MNCSQYCGCSRTIFRIDMGFQIGVVLWPLLESTKKIQVLLAHGALISGSQSNP